MYVVQLYCLTMVRVCLLDYILGVVAWLAAVFSLFLPLSLLHALLSNAFYMRSYP